MNPIALDTLQAAQDRRNAWLIEAGRIAKRLNRDSTRDSGAANNRPERDQ